MYGLWRFAYQVNNGLSVVAFDVGNNAHCHRHLFPVFPVFGDDTFCKIHCRTQVIQIQLLTETTSELIVNRSVCRFFATAWTFWLIYVVDNYFMWPGFFNRCRFILQAFSPFLNQQAAVNVFSTEPFLKKLNSGA
ncbi:Uncharacterised protein [Salmonella enterica subsp. enterica serovar Typhimurium str. DT104]|nr:Uncharacterised protein [Salmonella enterica subsp. enterica serovar Typhimurium str. DT104]CQA87966.1 Uncharacterised protein [Salmonella enterica subsp. enterica serovar Typhimurium str. DT104]CQA96770.1 Uncharacterised protein [Salmonella enterica subsp. enterica serovar Typhimurium str. DT104]CQB09554.1 Uncharacterised protein [Salmonella enterica subsp. enterica serovar Typhimurium str. DT104]CQB12037.1 Uncharacterised protein [Salmonella enterica subsp. enterica serovar Typhimurium str